jgi:hypothetical protein
MSGGNQRGRRGKVGGDRNQLESTLNCDLRLRHAYVNRLLPCNSVVGLGCARDRLSASNKLLAEAVATLQPDDSEEINIFDVAANASDDDKVVPPAPPPHCHRRGTQTRVVLSRALSR